MANGLQAVAELNRLRPQYAFLDIRMPGLSGLEAGKGCKRNARGLRHRPR